MAISPQLKATFEFNKVSSAFDEMMDEEEDLDQD